MVEYVIVHGDCEWKLHHISDSCLESCTILLFYRLQLDFSKSTDMSYVRQEVITFINFPQKFGRECRPFFLNVSFCDCNSSTAVFINFSLSVLGLLFMNETYLIPLSSKECDARRKIACLSKVTSTKCVIYPPQVEYRMSFVLQNDTFFIAVISNLWAFANERFRIQGRTLLSA